MQKRGIVVQWRSFAHLRTAHVGIFSGVCDEWHLLLKKEYIVSFGPNTKWFDIPGVRVPQLLSDSFVGTTGEEPATCNDN